MSAAWYETQGPASVVLVVGEMPDPEPGHGEVRIRLAASGINPGDVKRRQDAAGVGHSLPPRDPPQRRRRRDRPDGTGCAGHVGGTPRLMVRRAELPALRYGGGVRRGPGPASRPAAG